MNTFSGVLLGESIRSDAVLDGIPLLASPVPPKAFNGTSLRARSTG